MQRPHEDAVNDLRDAGVFGVGHEVARRRLAGGRRPRRAVIAWEGRDFGEARMVYAASEWEEVSFAGSASTVRPGKKSSGPIETPICGATIKMRRICAWVRLLVCRFSLIVWGRTPAASANFVWVPKRSGEVR